MSKRLFVGGLPYKLTNNELQDLFAPYGEITSCSIITDKFSGQSKGFGFVEYVNDADADKAVEAVNGMDVQGRKIAVNVARPLEDRPRNDGPRRDYGDRRGGNSGGGDFRRDRR